MSAKTGSPFGVHIVTISIVACIIASKFDKSTVANAANALILVFTPVVSIESGTPIASAEPGIESSPAILEGQMTVEKSKISILVHKGGLGWSGPHGDIVMGTTMLEETNLMTGHCRANHRKKER